MHIHPHLFVQNGVFKLAFSEATYPLQLHAKTDNMDFLEYHTFTCQNLQNSILEQLIF